MFSIGKAVSTFGGKTAPSATKWREVKMTRQSLALWLRAEYGQRLAIEALRTAPRGRLTRVFFRTRRDQSRFCERALALVNHQRGRLGVPAGDGVFADPPLITR